MRPVRFGAAVVIVTAGAYCASLLPSVRENLGSAAFWDGGVYVAVFIGAALVCGIRAISVRADRLAWGFIAAGMFLYAAGNVVYRSVVQKGNYAATSKASTCPSSSWSPANRGQQRTTPA